MLQTQTVNPTLLRVLGGLMSIKNFDQLVLVGGTGLALQLGHRESIDIDLFGRLSFDYNAFGIDISEIGKVEVISLSKHINVLLIDNIKVDFVNYKYDWLSPPLFKSTYRIGSMEDIAAMKLKAITGRGSKKDFVDLYYLLRLFSFKELFDFYERKYDDGNLFLVKKSLSFFDDAEGQQCPKIFDDLTWQEMKLDIIEKLRIAGVL